MPHRTQGCAGWTRNPKGPQITPFCHQLGRHPTVLDATSAGFRQISARRSLGGSRPLNLNFLFHHFGAQKWQNVNFWEVLKMDCPNHGGFGVPWGPRGPWGPWGPHGGPWGPHGSPVGPKGAHFPALPHPWGVFPPSPPSLGWYFLLGVGIYVPSWTAGKAREGRLHRFVRRPFITKVVVQSLLK